MSTEWLKEYEIPLYSQSEQEEIAAILDCCRKIISDRENELKQLDDLIKARFIEMFGDCKNMVLTADLCTIITDGTHQPPQFQDTGIPFIFVSNLSENRVTYNTEKFISEDTYNELIKRTPIKKGDVLLTTVGSYGHPAVVIEDRKFLFQRHIAYMKPKSELINSFYLHSALLAPDAQRQIEEKVKGIAQKTLNLSEIKKIEIPVPDMEQQQQFAAFVAQVDKSKVAVQKALDETQLLFDSLMQKYFG
jgi:type I restriction enzyme S subunit